jgi:hypothetical protein
VWGALNCEVKEKIIVHFRQKYSLVSCGAFKGVLKSVETCGMYNIRFGGVDQEHIMRSGFPRQRMVGLQRSNLCHKEHVWAVQIDYLNIQISAVVVEI